MKTWALIVLATFSGVLSAGIILLGMSSPRGEAVKLSPLPTASQLAIHVTGAVAQPGVYSLEAGSRVMDALHAAGGVLDGGDAQQLNLAAVLTDGEQIRVPLKGESIEGTSPSPGKAINLPPSYPIDLNTATQAQLEGLPAIGEVKAQAIISYRKLNGPFLTCDDLQLVPGIGAVIYEAVKDLITVGNVP